MDFIINFIFPTIIFFTLIYLVVLNTKPLIYKWRVKNLFKDNMLLELDFFGEKNTLSLYLGIDSDKVVNVSHQFETKDYKNSTTEISLLYSQNKLTIEGFLTYFINNKLELTNVNIDETTRLKSLISTRLQTLLKINLMEQLMSKGSRIDMSNTTFFQNTHSHNTYKLVIDDGIESTSYELQINFEGIYLSEIKDNRVRLSLGRTISSHTSWKEAPVELFDIVESMCNLLSEDIFTDLKLINFKLNPQLPVEIEALTIPFEPREAVEDDSIYYLDVRQKEVVGNQSKDVIKIP